jgi:hypothetical protein
MTRFLLGTAALLSTTALAPAQTGKQAGRFGWHSSYESAKAEARKTGKPIFLVFRCEP